MPSKMWIAEKQWVTFLAEVCPVQYVGNTYTLDLFIVIWNPRLIECPVFCPSFQILVPSNQVF